MGPNTSTRQRDQLEAATTSKCENLFWQRNGDPVAAEQEVSRIRDKTLAAYFQRSESFLSMSTAAPQSRTKTCLFFSKGHCRFGPSCKFVHESPAPGTSALEPVSLDTSTFLPVQPILQVSPNANAVSPLHWRNQPGASTSRPGSNKRKQKQRVSKINGGKQLHRLHVILSG